jgi:hypothetical protein
MVKKFVNYTLRLESSSKVRTEYLEGQKCLVAPCRMLIEGVHNGSQGPGYYSKEEISAKPAVWNHMPIMVGHPKDSTGKYISARSSAGVLNSSKVGILLNTKVTDGGKYLDTEAWFIENRVKQIDNRIYDALNNNTPMEVSTGLDATIIETSGIWNSEKYDFIVTNFEPDHLAILPDQIGACSLADGAGLLVNQGKLPQAFSQTLTKAVQNQLSKIGAIYNGSELSFDDIASSLNSQLSAKYGQPGKYWNGYLYEIFQTNVVFRNEDGKLYKIGYKTDSSGVSLSGESVQVKQTVTYEPITSKDKTMTNEEKTKIVNQMIATGKFTEEDRESLMNTAHQLLPKITAVFSVQNKEAATTPVVNKEEKTVEQPKPMKFDDLMKTLDPQSQNIMNEMKKAYIENKKNLIDQILANKSNTFTKEQLDAFDDIDVLKGIAALAKSTTPVANNSNPLSIMQGQYAGQTTGMSFPTVPLDEKHETLLNEKVSDLEAWGFAKK